MNHFSNGKKMRSHKNYTFLRSLNMGRPFSEFRTLTRVGGWVGSSKKSPKKEKIG